MKIFISYPSTLRETAASLNYELQAGGHEVFFDKDDLPAGQSYNEKIRKAIADCELMIFLITPRSVAHGHYTLTELKLAGRKWPSPTGHVLPVMAETTPLEQIPAYLKTVTILTPEGNLTAEVLIEVAELAAKPTAITVPDDHLDAAAIESFSYQPVELRFGAGNGGNYPLSLTASPAGNVTAQPCALDADGWAGELWTASTSIAGAARRDNPTTDATAAVQLPSEAAARQVGERLYRALFNPRLDAPLRNSLRAVDGQRRAGLRFLINTTDAPDLARLPWEFLYDPQQEDFLFSDRMKPIIRWLDVDQPPPKLAIEPPLRLLIAIAAPLDRPELNVGPELAHLDHALRDLVEQGRVTTSRLEHTTLEKLDDALLTQQPHLLHFIGHGDFIGDDGVIFLEAEGSGAADPIAGRRLAVLLRNHLASLRFVFLNSCLGAAVSRRDPFGGVAQNLIRRGVPAVIAMQFPVPDAVAVILARHFYRYLAAGMPVDAALTSARAFLYARGYPVEWGAPTLHMRTPDGHLFQVSNAPAAAQATVGATPPVEVGGEKLPATADLEPVNAASRRWLWSGLALLALAVFAGIWLSQPARINLEHPPPVPPPIGTTSPPQTTAIEHYQAALKALGKDDFATAERRMAEARRLDSNSQALVAAPEMRRALSDALLEKVRQSLAEGNIEGANNVAAALTEIDPARAAAELTQRIPAAGGEPMVSSRKYRVKPGDTLWHIAAAHYGDPKKWHTIHQTNQTAIANPDMIFPGQELTLPVANTIAPWRRYTVKSGDTLWHIAQSMYGDASRWQSIYNANQTRIPAPDHIIAGQELLIP